MREDLPLNPGRLHFRCDFDYPGIERSSFKIENVPGQSMRRAMNPYSLTQGDFLMGWLEINRQGKINAVVITYTNALGINAVKQGEVVKAKGSARMLVNGQDLILNCEGID